MNAFPTRIPFPPPATTLMRCTVIGMWREAMLGATGWPDRIGSAVGGALDNAQIWSDNSGSGDGPGSGDIR